VLKLTEWLWKTNGHPKGCLLLFAWAMAKRLIASIAIVCAKRANIYCRRLFRLHERFTLKANGLLAKVELSSISPARYV